MPPNYREYGERWRELNPHWTIRTWGEEDLVWLENRGLFESAETYSEKADVARYEIVFREGGLYVDCDVEPLQPLGGLLDDTDLLVAEELPGVYANGFFAASPGHPLIGQLVADLPSSFEANEVLGPVERTGPGFFSRTVLGRSADLGVSPTVIDRDLVHPYGYKQTHLRFHSFPAAVAVHRWAGSWTPHSQPGPKSMVKKTSRDAARSAMTALKRWRTEVSRRWASIEPVSWPPSDRDTHVLPLGNELVLFRRPGMLPLLVPSGRTEVLSSLLTGQMDAVTAATRSLLRPGDTYISIADPSGLASLAAAESVGYSGRVWVLCDDRALSRSMAESFKMNLNYGLKTEAVVGDLISEEDAISLRATFHSRELIGLGAQAPIPSVRDVIGRLAEVRLLYLGSPPAVPATLRHLWQLFRDQRIVFVCIVLPRRGLDKFGVTKALLRFSECFQPSCFALLGHRLNPMPLALALQRDDVRHIFFFFAPPHHSSDGDGTSRQRILPS